AADAPRSGTGNSGAGVDSGSGATRGNCMADVTLEGLLAEGRTFPPSPELVASALVTDRSLHDGAAADPEGFWAGQAGELLDWSAPWSTVLEWDLPFAKWFVGGQLNASYNCVDRHVVAGHGD